MQFILFGGIVLALLLLSSRFPKLAYLVLAGLVVAVVLLYRFTGKGDNVLEQSLPLSDIALSNISMRPAYADSFDFKGRITNQSREQTLRDVAIKTTMLDCPPDNNADSPDCVTIGEGTDWITVNVPPTQARDFSRNVSLGSSQAKGTLQWKHVVVGSHIR